MKSPYKQGNGPYEDINADRILQPKEEMLIEMGYKFLGWNVTHDEVPEYGHCVDEAHNYASAFPGAWQSIVHDSRGADVTQWCTKCKIYWKVDMSE